MIQLLVGLLFLSLAQARIIDPEDYKYNIQNPLKASIAGSVMYAGRSTHQELKIKIYNREIDGYLKYNDLKVKYYPAAGKKLIFILSGLGEEGDGNIACFLATLAQQQGFPSVVMPNSLTPNFLVAASSQALTGIASLDAKDMYRAMKLVLKKLKLQGHAYSETQVMGYSHGAMMAAFVAQLEEKRTELGIQSTLMICPPFDLKFSAEVLDRFDRFDVSLRRLLSFGPRLKNVIKRHRVTVTTMATHSELVRALTISDGEAKDLIADSMRSTLMWVILTSQEHKDFGILPPSGPYGALHLDEREFKRRNAASRYNFMQYFNTFYRAQFRGQGLFFSEEILRVQNSLVILDDFLAQSDSVYLMHNVDDFLLAPGNVEWMERIFGDRALIYPKGGHMGNVWYADNQKNIRQWISTGKWGPSMELPVQLSAR